MASSIYRLGNLSPQAVAGILCSLPLAASMFYIVSAKTGFFSSRSRGYLNETSCRLLYVFTEFLVGGIILTYAWELSCLLVVPFMRTVITWIEGTVYLLGSAIFWYILLLVYLKPRGILSISLGGCSLLYLVPELFLVTSSVYPTQLGKIMTIFLICIRAIRFVSLVLLVCVVVGSWTVPCHCESDPEAAASLIPEGHAHRDAVQNRQDERMNYGATAQDSDPAHIDLWPGQPRRRPSMKAVSSRRLQPPSALQGIEEEVHAEDTDHIVGNDHEQSLGDEIPALSIAKLRHKPTEPQAQHEDQGEMQHIQSVDHSSGINSRGRKPVRRGEWKPDAPEFIPIAQQRIVMQRLDANRDPQVDRQHVLGLKEIQQQGLGAEGFSPNAVNSQMAKSAVPSFPITDENESPRPAASTKHRTRAAESDNGQSATGSQEESDRVIIAYPKRARKRGRRSRKEAMSCRKGTKSEPAGLGLATDIDHPGTRDTSHG